MLDNTSPLIINSGSAKLKNKFNILLCHDYCRKLPNEIRIIIMTSWDRVLTNIIIKGDQLRFNNKTLSMSENLMLKTPLKYAVSH